LPWRPACQTSQYSRQESCCCWKYNIIFSPVYDVHASARLGQQIANSVSYNWKVESCGVTAHTHVLHGYLLHNNLAPLYTTMVYLLPRSILQWKVHVMYDELSTRIQTTRNNTLINKI
jgi:hypothetical protein